MPAQVGPARVVHGDYRLDRLAAESDQRIRDLAPGVGTTVKSLVVLAMAAAPDSMRKPAESIPLVARPVGGFAAVVPHLGTGFGSTSKATRVSATNEFRFWPAVRDVGEHTAVV
jgi:hypothetical protein